jgi:glyoxylase-like metal-dependent hydrolase (beta-lactamase superfamily II)
MKITDHIYLTGSEQFGLSHALDCNCYLLDGGAELALVDCGLGLGVDDIWRNIQHAGFDPLTLRHVFITHSHIGHFGGAAALRDRTGCRVWAHALAAASMSDVENDLAIQMNFRFGRYPTGFKPRGCKPDATFNDGDTLHVGILL